MRAVGSNVAAPYAAAQKSIHSSWRLATATRPLGASRGRRAVSRCEKLEKKAERKKERWMERSRVDNMSAV